MSDILINVSNDNLYVHRMFRFRNGEHGDHLDLMKHRTLAQMLIKKYSEHPYKHSLDHPDYMFLEYQLCTILDLPVKSPAQRTFLLSDLSWLLGISAIKLMDDRLLSLEPTGLARFP